MIRTSTTDNIVFKTVAQATEDLMGSSANSLVSARYSLVTGVPFPAFSTHADYFKVVVSGSWGKQVVLNRLQFVV